MFYLLYLYLHCFKTLLAGFALRRYLQARRDGIVLWTRTVAVVIQHHRFYKRCTNHKTGKAEAYPSATP